MAPATSISDPKAHIGSAGRAIDALLDWTRTRPKHQKAQLFEPDDLLYVLLTLTRIPASARTNPYRIQLPHPLHSFDPESTSICLIASDPLAAEVQTRIREDSLPISTVISLSDLRSDYRPYESRRKLRDSYDLFFADRKIVSFLPKLLGKHFFDKKKIPLAVDLSRPGWPEQVRALCGASLLYLKSGTCCALKVGRVTMGKDAILENVVAAVEGAVAVVPKGWDNVRSLHLKMSESPALPIYEVLPEIGLKIEGFKEEEEDVGEVVDEEVVVEKKVAKKKGRIHEVDYMDACDAIEKSEENIVEEGTKKRKKGKKSKVVEDGDNNDDEDLSAKKKKSKKKKNGGDEEVNDDEDMGAKMRKKKKSKVVESGGDDAANSSAKKGKKTKKVEDVNVSADGSNRKSKTMKSEKKEEKKAKRSKLKA